MAITIRANKRPLRPKSAVRNMRRLGKVPGTVYGKGTDNVHVAVDATQMHKVLRDKGEYAVMKLDVEGDKTYQVMLYDVQRDPMSERLLHVDFKTIRMDEPVISEVPIEVVGEARGVRDGGILQQPLRALEVRSLPDKRPETIECSVEHLAIGDSLAVKDLPIPEGIDVLTDGEEIVVSVVPPAKAEPVGEGETKEPELVENTTDGGKPEDE